MAANTNDITTVNETSKYWKRWYVVVIAVLVAQIMGYYFFSVYFS